MTWEPIVTTRATAMLYVAALALVSCTAFAQSAEQLRSYRNFENAKAANNTPQALAYGKEAIRLTENGGDNQVLTELLLSVADYAAQVGNDEQAVGYYTRALKLQEAALGAAHPRRCANSGPAGGQSWLPAPSWGGFRQGSALRSKRPGFRDSPRVLRHQPRADRGRETG